MDHAEIEERQVIDRYLLGNLREADAARFEQHYLGCQQCLDELELAERMQGAARTAASEDASRVAAQELAAVQGLAIFAWLARRGRFVQLATMAILVLLPATALLRQIPVHPEDGPPIPALDLPESPLGGGQAELFAPQPGTMIISLRPERGGPDAVAPSLQLDLPSPPRWLVFSVEIEPPLEVAYRVVLQRGAVAEEVWRIENLEPDFSGLLNVSFHSSFFEDDNYLLVVDAVTPEGGAVLVGRHAFRVVTSG